MRKKDEEETDRQIFRDAMRDVKPLSPHKPRVTPRRPTGTARQKPPPVPDAPEPESYPFSDYEKHAPVGTDDLLCYARSGISEKRLRNLRAGQYNATAVLDLHGRTTDEARRALGTFLQNCQLQKIQCALIIHGRGTGIPVLKNRLNHWLRETPLVLAFCSVNQGALRILLRRKAF